LTLTALTPALRVLAFLVAVIAAMWIAARLARRRGGDAAWSRATVAGCAVTGLFAARLAHVTLHWEAFSASPATALFLWQSGYLPVAGIAAGGACLLYRWLTVGATRRAAGVRPIVAGLAAGSVLLAGSLAGLDRLSGDAGLGAGDRMPDFELVNLYGEPVAFSELSGRPVVLNFWATWCAPCRREMPLLETLWNELRGDDLVVVGVALGESPGVVRPFVDARGVSYPIWLDREASDARGTQDVFDRLRSRGLPTTVFVRADGIIDSVYLGELERTLLRERIEAILPGPG